MCALIALPLLMPVFLVIALAILFTSQGPVLFLQKRAGRHNRGFTILKFRTLEHREQGTHNSVTTAENQRFTPVGPFLRKWKLDELPQLLNVLIGDMKSRGHRPKLLKHQLGRLHCRPGITGAATIAFARESKYSRVYLNTSWMTATARSFSQLNSGWTRNTWRGPLFCPT